MKRINLAFLVLILITMSGCADAITFVEAAQRAPVGFWHGLWHGMTTFIAFFGSLFMDDVTIYAIYNNGGWYNFGYVLGLGIISGRVVVRKE